MAIYDGGEYQMTTTPSKNNGDVLTASDWNTHLHEQFVILQSGIVGTDYSEKLRFWVPSQCSVVKIKLCGYKPSPQVLQHSHGSHTHSYRTAVNYAYFKEMQSSYNFTMSGAIVSATVGSGTAVVNPAFPNNLIARINGNSAGTTSPVGNGSDDAESDWIDWTSYVTTDATNYIQLKADTAGCAAICIIKLQTG